MKSRLLVSIGVLSAVALSSAGIASAIGNDDCDGWLEALESKAAEIRIGYRIAPVPLNVRGRNAELVGLGSYIINAQGACNDCHTHPSFAPGGNPYLGQPELVNPDQYLTGGRVFGPLKSANLTPDSNGRPAGLTFAEFREALRTGRDPDGSGRILQVMPWPIYGKMTELDLRAIYEYLRAIPARPDNPAPGP